MDTSGNFLWARAMGGIGEERLPYINVNANGFRI